MKPKSLFYIILVLIFCTVSGNNDVEAQRRTVVVHRRPSRTVVVTRIPRHRIVYVNRRIVRPAIRVLSPAAIAITYGRTKYFYDSGYYYILEKDGYRIVAPPAGMVVTALPSHYVRVKANSISCLYLDGIFYEKIPEGYRIIEPPVGAQIKNLSEDAEEVTVDKEVFYELNGTLYKQVQTNDGTVYEVSGVIKD